MTRKRTSICDNLKSSTQATCDKNGELGRVGCCFALIAIVALACAGCQTKWPPLPYPPGRYTPVRLSPGDTIKVAFAENADLDQTEKIRRDGKISLPLIGEVQAAGKRIMDFQNQLIGSYDQHLDNPDVLVTLENSPATVTVSGFVNNPNKVEFDRPTTVYQAIMQAGGVSDFGSFSNIHLTRIINGVQRTESLNLRPAIRGQPIQPEYVQDGDVIYIGRSLF